MPTLRPISSWPLSNPRLCSVNGWPTFRKLEPLPGSGTQIILISGNEKGSYLQASAPSRVRLSAVPWTVALQAPLSMGFPRREYWSWVTISFSRGSSLLIDLTHVSCVSCTGRWILYH